MKRRISLMRCTPLQIPLEWKKVVGRHFLLGVPFVGAQEPVYKSIVDQMSSRDERCWLEWGDNEQRVALARFAASRFGEAADWPNPIFVPDDPFILVVWDHDACNADDLRVESALDAIETRLGVSLNASEWESMQNRTFGQVVDELMRRSGRGA